MKKIFTLFLIIMLMTGCAKTPKNDGRFIVYTSFGGMTDFAEMIAGDKAEIRTLIPAGVEAHDWEPGTNEMIALNEADVFIYSGMNMEPWAEGVIESVDNKDLMVIMASDGIEQKKNENATDPHVWLNPENALKEMENIANGLKKADPGNGDYYMSNLEKAKERIKELDNKYKEAVDGFEHKEIIVTHGAFGYLCDAYGLTQYTLEGMTGESDPSSAAMREVVDYMKGNDIKALFYIEAEGDKLASVIGKETGASLYTLNPFENAADGKGYFEVMEENLQSMEKALGKDE